MPGKGWTIQPTAIRRQVLLVFVRAPELGRVKTRLARDLGAKKALTLYKTFVQRVLASAAVWAGQGGGRDLDRAVWVCYTPGDQGPAVRAWLGEDGVYLAQSGSDLGERMARAMAHAFDQGAGEVALVGTDIPDLTPALLEEAFEAFSRAEVVLGPSLDGGYWLVGALATRFSNALFDGIPWSTGRVMAETVARCQDLGIRWAQVSPLQDVDRAKDLDGTSLAGYL